MKAVALRLLSKKAIPTSKKKPFLFFTEFLPSSIRWLASRRFASLRVASRRFASRRFASLRVASRRFASRRFASLRVASRNASFASRRFAFKNASQLREKSQLKELRVSWLQLTIYQGKNIASLRVACVASLFRVASRSLRVASRSLREASVPYLKKMQPEKSS